MADLGEQLDSLTLARQPIGAIDELRARDQWVGWQSVDRGGPKPTKIPVNPKNGRAGSSTDPTTWASHADAKAAEQRFGVAGVGYVLTPDDDYTGIDIDSCRDPSTGALADWARDIIDLGETYAEVSPSGTGVRLFARGKVASATFSRVAGVEIYGTARYLTVTGKQIDGTPNEIRPAPRTIQALLARKEALDPKKELPASTAPVTLGAPVGQREKTWASVALDATIQELSTTGSGGRNAALNASAYRLGRMVARGWLSTNKVQAALEDACKCNGVWKDDGPRQVRATIASGLRSGIAKPHEDLEDRPQDDEAERLGAQIAASYAARANPIPDHLTVRFDPETGEIIDGATPSTPTHAKQQRPIEMETISAASLAGKPIPAQHWLIKDLIPHGNVTMLAGDGATGKSLLGLQLGAAVATGKPWIGFYTQKGRAVFISAEDETAELHRRLACIEPRLDLLSDLIIVDLAGKDAVLAAPERDGMLKPTALFAALERVIDHNQPDLLILDTLADLFGGDEIKKVQARQFIAMLRGLALQHDMTVVLLSHPSQSGMNSGSGTSGNTAWNNSVRSRLYLERRLRAEGKRVIEDDRDLRILSTKKSNRSATGGQIVLRWKDGKFERETQSAVNAVDAAHHADRVFLALLDQFIREKRNVSPNKGPTYAPALFQGHENAKGMTGSELTRAMNRLLQSGGIEVEDFGPPSKLRQRLVIVAQGFDGDVSDAGDEADTTDHDLPEPAD